MEKTIFDDLGGKKLVLGLIHLKPMPATPFYEDGQSGGVAEKALGDAKALQNGGADPVACCSLWTAFTAPRTIPITPGWRLWR